MKRGREAIIFGIILAVFVGCYFLPVESLPVSGPLAEALYLVKWYAREHVLLCLVPAFFIAGAISVFVSQAAVMKYLGAGAKKTVAYGVASVSGSVLAVCSCTVLPLFAGIYRMGAGLGPATAFLYSGPAINVLAIILTARVLGMKLGVARAVGAVAFSIVIGLLMHLIFRREEALKAKTQVVMPEGDSPKPLWQTALYFAAMVGVLVFANWGAPNEWTFETIEGQTVRGEIIQAPEDPNAEGATWSLRVMDAASGEKREVELAAERVVQRTPVEGIWTSIWRNKWFITGAFLALLAVVLLAWFKRSEMRPWVSATWGFAKQILPLLLIGVLVAGVLLGRPGGEGLIPKQWVARWVGGNSVLANLFAAVVGAFMYFATLTEVPILKGLIDSGMGNGPALALLLAGPALSLPNMLVIRSVMGTKKTVVYVLLVVVMATISGLIFGALF